MSLRQARRLIAVLLLIGQVIGGQSFKSNIVQIDALEGETIRLPCKFNLLNSELIDQHDSPVYFWMRKTHNNTDNVSIKQTALDPGYKLDINPQEGKYDLIINSASYYRDNGHFECRVKKSGTGEDIKSTYYQLTILSAPNPPTIQPQFPIAHENQEFELTCYSTGGSPSPEIEWFRNGIPIPGELVHSQHKDQPTKNVLRIIPTQTDDRLFYKCIVYNKALPKDNATETQVQLTVYYTPRVTVGPSNPLDVYKNSDIIFTCNYVSNPSAKRITWKRNNKVIGSTVNHSIYNVDASDSGSYTCEVDNGILDKQGQNGVGVLSLNVLYPPVVTLPAEFIEPKIGEQVEINCEVNANPKPHSISFYKIVNGVKKLVQEGAQMIMNSVRPEDSGLYVCVAQNSLKASDSQIAQTHTANSTIEIKVKHAPQTVFIIPEQPVAISGKSYNLTCKSQPEAHPKPNYKWWKDSEPDNILSWTPELIFKPIHVRQEGKYSCSAENELGRSEPSTVDLVINEPPLITFQMQPTIIKKQAETGFSLTCRARGKPTPRVTWMHNQQLISDEPTFNQYDEQIVSMYRIETTSNQEASNSIESILYFESPARKNKDELIASDHGRYFCMFDNGLTEQPVKAETFVKVEHAPILKHEHNRVAFDIGEHAALQCKMSCYPKCNFEWYLENRLIDRSYGIQPKYNISITEIGDDVWMSTLYVANVKKSDYGDYMCKGWNSLGDDEKTIIKLVEKSAPETPTHLQIVEIQSDYVILSWQPGFDGGFHMTEYILSYSNEDSMFSKWRNETCRTMNPCKLTNLHSRKIYQFKVMANNPKGHSTFSEAIEGVTKVSFKDIPIPFEAYYDNVYNMVTFKIDPIELDLTAKIEVKTTMNTATDINADGEEQITEQEHWKLLVTSDMKNDNEHVIYLPIIQPPEGSLPLKDKKPGLETKNAAQYNDMRVSICLKTNTTLCSLTQSVKMDYVSSYYRDNRVYSIEQLILFLLVGGSLALGLVLSIVFFVNRKRVKHSKKDYESDSDSGNGAKVSTISNNYFNSNDSKALVDSQDDSTKMMPPPVYTTSPNTPTSAIGLNAGLSQNLQLSNNYGTANYFMNGSDQNSPNGSAETAQSDLWMMKNELMMTDGQQLVQQQMLPQSHYGNQDMMNGMIANTYPQQYNTYGSPIDYSYSYYSRNQPEEYQPLATAEDNYNMNVKNSLYAPYYGDENGYGTTTLQIVNSQQTQIPPPITMDTNDYYNNQQQQLAFEDETGYNNSQSNNSRVIREIIV